MTPTVAVQRYRRLVLKCARRYARPGIEAEDLAQVGFMALVRCAEQYDDGGRFVSVASVSVHRALRAYLRTDGKRGRKHAVLLSLDAPLDGEEMCLHDVLGVEPPEREVGDVLWRIIDALPNTDRDLLRRWACGARVTELAAEHGVSHQAVSRRVRLALERVRTRWRAASRNRAAA
jgi:RNA polymerase sigma factor (sigma-70 family)